MNRGNCFMILKIRGDISFNQKVIKYPRYYLVIVEILSNKITERRKRN